MHTSRLPQHIGIRPKVDTLVEAGRPACRRQSPRRCRRRDRRRRRGRRGDEGGAGRRSDLRARGGLARPCPSAAVTGVVPWRRLGRCECRLVVLPRLEVLLRLEGEDLERLPRVPRHDAQVQPVHLHWQLHLGRVCAGIAHSRPELGISRTSLPAPSEAAGSSMEARSRSGGSGRGPQKIGFEDKRGSEKTGGARIPEPSAPMFGRLSA